MFLWFFGVGTRTKWCVWLSWLLDPQCLGVLCSPLTCDRPFPTVWRFFVNLLRTNSRICGHPDHLPSHSSVPAGGASDVACQVPLLSRVFIYNIMENDKVEKATCDSCSISNSGGSVACVFGLRAVLNVVVFFLICFPFSRLFFFFCQCDYFGQIGKN